MEIELFDKQAKFFEANNRINVYGGGIQSGKTTAGALKMYMAMLEHRDPDDTFIVAADTYKTLSQATVPKFMKWASKLGRLNRSDGEFRTKWGSTVYFRTGTHPESMEGITNVRRVWLDEGGKVSLYFFENIMGRAAFKEAPIDISTTPYAMNWLAKLCNDAVSGKRDDVFFVNCRSVDSPYFPKAEYDRQRLLLDPRRFAMKYDGQFGKMEGLVYDRLNLCQSFALPNGTVYYGGVDWGYYPDPFCLVVRALTPEGLHYRVQEYYRNYLTISDIVKAVKSLDSMFHFKMLYCDPSQPAHIEELNRAGIRAMGANNDIRLGIDRHYELIKQEKHWIFEDRNPIGLDEYNTYHYREPKELELDQDLARKASIPVDQSNHGLDAERYVTIMLSDQAQVKRIPVSHTHSAVGPSDPEKRLKWLKAGGSSKYNRG